MKYTIKFQASSNENLTPEQFEIYLQDLLNKAVLPTLNSDLVPLSLVALKIETPSGVHRLGRC
jgi:hypothetical protein